MSINCAIGLVTANDTIVSVYCHNDGNSVGSILKHFYKTDKKIFNLLQKGWISVLRPTIETTIFYKDTQSLSKYDPVLSNSEKEFLQRWSKVDYIYLSYKRVWYVYDKQKNGWEQVRG